MLRKKKVRLRLNNMYSPSDNPMQKNPSKSIHPFHNLQSLSIDIDGFLTGYLDTTLYLYVRKDYQ